MAPLTGTETAMRPLFLALLLLAAAPAAAENLACQTVNGKTTCVEGSGTLACRTVNGKTTCTHTPEQRVCEVKDGRVLCPSGREVSVDLPRSRARLIEEFEKDED